MSLSLWEYKICDCRVKVTQAPSIFGRQTEGYWMLIIDGQETGLEEGLAKLGQKGWELAGIQLARSEDHSVRHAWTFPESKYVFKRFIGNA